MKVLILSTATGQGHNSAGMSIKEYLDSHGCETLFVDALDCKSKKASKRASNIYTGVTTHAPKLFGIVYKAGDIVSSANIVSPVYIANSLHSKKLLNLIESFSPDVLLCSHPFPAETLTKLKHKYNLKVPTVEIATDYTCSPFFEDGDMDYFIIPHKSLEEEFIKKGINKEKLLPYGIPVKHKFRTKVNKDKARKTFGFKAKHVYALMGGSMGFGNFEGLIKELLSKDPECEIAIVCGYNKKLLENFKNKPRIKAFGFIDNVNILMDACDVLMTKPGGLSSTEAITKGVPLILTPPIPGCETKNEEFLTEKGVALSAKSAKEAAAKAIQLVNDGEERKNMLASQKEFSKLDTQKEIGELILSLKKR